MGDLSGRHGHARELCAVRVLVIALLAVLAVPAVTLPVMAQEEPEPFTPAWYEREARNHADAHGRTTDQLSNLSYQQLRAEVCSSGTSDAGACSGDPHRRLEAWNGVRGHAVEVSFANRYGAVLHGDLWAPIALTDPVTGAVDNGPFPGVVIVSAYGFDRFRYRAFAQGLAEAGYLVLTFDPQGQGESDAAGDPEHCDPEGAWREPQEMGIRETGACAGQDPEPEGTTQDLPYLLPILLSGDARSVQELYVALRPRFVFGALDATDWLLSDGNPLRHLLDDTRLGIAGHSLGAYAAMMVANGDPLQRFGAGISWDSFAHLDNGVTPAVPTMFQQSEQENLLGPRAAPPEHPERLHPARESHNAFQASCVDTKLLVLRSSTHREWSYFAPGPVTEASRKGERVALHQSLAWFDRYLKGVTTTHVRGDEEAQASDALHRLDGAVFDDSADRSSIGTGAWSLSDGNVPYTIAGELVADHLSNHYASDTGVRSCVAATQAPDAPAPPAAPPPVERPLPATGSAAALAGALLLGGALLAGRGRHHEATRTLLGRRATDWACRVDGVTSRGTDPVSEPNRSGRQPMPIVERTVVIPLPLEEAWDAFFGDDLQNWVRLSDIVSEVRDYRMRADGTPEYVMVNRMGPMRASHRSDYVVYDPPHRAEDDTLDSPLGGRWATIHEPDPGGTRITHRWNVEPHGPMKVLFPLIRPFFQRSFQKDLDAMAARLRDPSNG